MEQDFEELKKTSLDVSRAFQEKIQNALKVFIRIEFDLYFTPLASTSDIHFGTEVTNKSIDNGAFMAVKRLCSFHFLLFLEQSLDQLFCVPHGKASFDNGISS